MAPCQCIKAYVHTTVGRFITVMQMTHTAHRSRRWQPHLHHIICIPKGVPDTSEQHTRAQCSAPRLYIYGGYMDTCMHVCAVYIHTQRTMHRQGQCAFHNSAPCPTTRCRSAPRHALRSAFLQYAYHQINLNTTRIMTYVRRIHVTDAQLVVVLVNSCSNVFIRRVSASFGER